MENIFQNSFIDKIKEYLDVKCADSTCVSRKDLIKDLNIPKMWDNTIGAMIKAGVVIGYVNHKGPNGGIGKASNKPTKRAASSDDNVVFPDKFLDALEVALTQYCKSAKQPVTRKEIAKYLNDSHEFGNSEGLITSALKINRFRDRWGTRAGRNGGIIPLTIMPVTNSQADNDQVDEKEVGMDVPFAGLELSDDSDSNDESEDDSDIALES